jgi:predicted nuclease with TOPRIM domain
MKNLNSSDSTELLTHLREEIDRLHHKLEVKARENKMLLDQTDRILEHAAAQVEGQGLTDAEIESLRNLGSSWMSETGREELEDWINVHCTMELPCK